MNIKEKMLTLGIVVISIVLLITLPSAIKFTTRIFLALLKNPLEALCFLTWCITMVGVAIYIEEREKAW
tara:strand:- start:404 stop:610 length:207 start_codon:yes stop_codon:yes gene_type:complete